MRSGKSKASENQEPRPSRTNNMKKLLASILLLTAAAIAIAGPLISSRTDEITESCAARLKSAVDGMLEHPNHYQHETEGGGYPTGPVKAALYYAYLAEQEMHSSGYKDLFTRNGKFALMGSQTDADVLTARQRNVNEAERARIQAAHVATQEHNALVLKLRRAMIDTVISRFYIDGFVDRVVRSAVIRPDSAGTLLRIRTLKPVVEHCIAYTEKWNDEVFRTELEWLKQCSVVAAIENQRDDHSIDGGHVTASDAEEKNQLVAYRFNHYGPGEWTHESDAVPLTERASTRFAETFIFRRIHTDGMTKEQVLLILGKVAAKLEAIQAEHTLTW